MTESVLFICEDNSVLSQMADVFLRKYGWSSFKVYSAGIVPKPVHLYTFQVLEEIGYDLYGLRAKSIFELNDLPRVDYLITLSDYVNDHFVFKEQNIGQHLHWPFRNPLTEPGQSSEILLPPNIKSSSDNAWSLPLDYWLPSDSSLISVGQLTKLVLQVSNQEPYQRDVTEIRNRFRKTRDEMEIQVMNWLEEKGIGPLWWRGNHT